MTFGRSRTGKPIAEVAVRTGSTHHASMPAKSPGGDEMRVERSLVDDLATRDVNKDPFSFIRFNSRAADQSSVAVVSAALMTRTSRRATSHRGDRVVAIQSVGSSLAPRRLIAWNFPSEGAHQPRLATDIAEAENTADATAQHRLALCWLNSPLLRLACSMNRRFAAASAQRDDCSDIGSVLRPYWRQPAIPAVGPGSGTQSNASGV